MSYLEIKNTKHYSIDWLRATSDFIVYSRLKLPLDSCVEKIDKLLEALKADYKYYELHVELGGLYGYKYRLCISEGITLYLYGPENKYGNRTCMLDIAGVGCDRFTSLDDWFNLVNLMKSEEFNFKFTRIDLAIDDFEGEDISMEDFFKHIDKKFYKRKGAPKSLPLWTCYDHNDYSKGCTIDFYSKQSKIQLCVYNKQAEQRVKKNLESNTKQWMRYEMRFFDEQCDSQINNFYCCLLTEKYNIKTGSSFVQFLSSALYELLVLYEPTNDTNKSRWIELDAWKKFIGDLSLIEFERPKAHVSKIKKTKFYFENNYSKFLSKLLLATDKEFFKNWIKCLMNVKVDKLESIDYIEVNELRKELGLEILDENELRNNLIELTKDYYNVTKYDI